MAATVSAPFPDLDLQDSSTITVDTQNANAKIVKLAIHFSQDTPSDLLAVAPAPPLFSFVPTAGS